MKKSFSYILVFMLHSFQVIAQLGPEPPVLKRVSTDPESGDITIVWEPSTDPETHGYSVKLVNDIPGYPSPKEIAGNIPPTDTQYIYHPISELLHSEGFCLTSLDEGGRDGVFSNFDSTIYLNMRFDSCNASIDLSWNDYNSWRGNISRYAIYVKINEQDYAPIQVFPEGINEYSFTELESESTYRFYVEAAHTDGRKSTSNGVQTDVQVPKAPTYLYPTEIVPGEDSLTISFITDPESELNTYFFYEGPNYDGVFLKTDSFITSNKQFQIIVEKEPEQVTYYKLSAANSCKIELASTDVFSNLVVEVANKGKENVLAWNYIHPIEDQSGTYTIYRKINNREDNFSFVQTTMDTAFTDHLTVLMDENNPLYGEICYAVEYQFNQKWNLTIHSNETCTTITPEVKIPNAFTPNADGLNDTFGPLLAVIPKEYSLVIFTERGVKIFESNHFNQRWDGKGFPQGTYGYSIEIITYDNQTIKKQGFVTLLLP